jgi:hypothetical protein
LSFHPVRQSRDTPPPPDIQTPGIGNKPFPSILLSDRTPSVTDGKSFIQDQDGFSGETL